MNSSIAVWKKFLWLHFFLKEKVWNGNDYGRFEWQQPTASRKTSRVVVCSKISIFTVYYIFMQITLSIRLVICKLIILRCALYRKCIFYFCQRFWWTFRLVFFCFFQKWVNDLVFAEGSRSCQYCFVIFSAMFDLIILLFIIQHFLEKSW